MGYKENARGWEGWFTPARGMPNDRSGGQAHLPDPEIFYLDSFSESLCLSRLSPLEIKVCLRRLTVIR
jgi:hypothetical protein